MKTEKMLKALLNNAPRWKKKSVIITHPHVVTNP